MNVKVEISTYADSDLMGYFDAGEVDFDKLAERIQTALEPIIGFGPESSVASRVDVFREDDGQYLVEITLPHGEIRSAVKKALKAAFSATTVRDVGGKEKKLNFEVYQQ